MDLHHTGSKEKRLILIETDLFTVSVSGKVKGYTKEIIDNFNTPAHFNVEVVKNCSIGRIKTIQSNGELGTNNSQLMYPAFFDTGNYQIFIENKDKDENKIDLYHVDERIENEVNDFGGHLVGSFKFRGEVGYSDFSILVNGHQVLTFTIEVFPAKMDYRKDYTEIMKEVNEEITALAFKFLGKTYHKSGLIDTEDQTPNEFYYILKTIYNRLKEALDQVEKRPKHRLLNIERVRNLEQTKRISRKTVDYLRHNPAKLIKEKEGIEIDGERYLPEKVIEKKKRITYDIFENRYIKYMLKRVLKRIRKIKRIIIEEYGRDNDYYEFLSKVEGELKGRINGFYDQVGNLKGRINSSLVFQMAPGYKEVNYYYLMLKKGLSLSQDLYNITPKKIWRLYEVWCYIKLNEILNQLGYNISEYGIIRADNRGLHLSLVQDEEAVMRYVNQAGREIELWYNKAYRSLPTNTQIPDNVLCLQSEDEDKRRIYIFDAKYRISISPQGGIGPKEEDINVMHRYRDAIVTDLEENDHFNYQTLGAYVMFPYSNEKEYMNHKFYKSIDKVNIGGFPMLPGSTSLIRKHLEEILDETEIEAQESIIRHQAYDDLDNYAKFKLQNVMVVNIKDPEHLEVYINHQFFHLPLKRLSNLRSGVEYVAFYQPESTFGDDSGIKYFAKVDKVREYKRGECEVLPANSSKRGKVYLRIELEEIQELERKIEPVEYGVVLINYTTLYLLENATTIHELKIESRQEVRLYKILKRLAKESGQKLKRYQDYYMLAENKIELLADKKARINGKIVEINRDKIESSLAIDNMI
ncbi:restriction endonuclease-like protein [Natroniella sulfidigena]|uniref:DUF2357 domain-containing protein n=1 Tax=Natroniella sulfidigena TaxID=723921 RepID=UPI00200B2A23|nr:DUF2357 domain-containing protein [Natroniella sulfidigena]MCK8817594.1 restriction endonuclease-like protein [Natroniella sulfidigena]